MRPRSASADKPGSLGAGYVARRVRGGVGAVVVALLMGGVITLVIAWPLSLLLIQLEVMAPSSLRTTYSEGTVALRRPLGSVPVLCARQPGPLSERVFLTVFGVDPRFRTTPLPTNPPPVWATSPIDGERVVATEIMTSAHGWPFRALASEIWRTQRNNDDKHVLLLRPGAQNPVRVPLRPIWRGLLLDTLIWSGVSLALLQTLGLRSRRRRRRGLCVACGYDLRGTAEEKPCPECGQLRIG